MIQNPYLSPAPVALPRDQATPLEYRAVEFHHRGEVQFEGDFKLEGGQADERTAVRVFFRPPQSGKSEEKARLHPEQPQPPDNADMFLNEKGLAAIQVPPAKTSPCVLELPDQA